MKYVHTRCPGCGAESALNPTRLQKHDVLLLPNLTIGFTYDFVNSMFAHLVDIKGTISSFAAARRRLRPSGSPTYNDVRQAYWLALELRRADVKANGGLRLQCPTCGPAPTVIVVDGTTLGLGFFSCSVLFVHI